MKIFLATAAVFAWVFALAMLLVPEKFFAPASVALTSLLATRAACPWRNAPGTWGHQLVRTECPRIWTSPACSWETCLCKCPLSSSFAR